MLFTTASMGLRGIGVLALRKECLKESRARLTTSCSTPTKGCSSYLFLSCSRDSLAGCDFSHMFSRLGLERGPAQRSLVAYKGNNVCSAAARDITYCYLRCWYSEFLARRPAPGDSDAFMMQAKALISRTQVQATESLEVLNPARLKMRLKQGRAKDSYPLTSKTLPPPHSVKISRTHPLNPSPLSATWNPPPTPPSPKSDSRNPRHGSSHRRRSLRLSRPVASVISLWVQPTGRSMSADIKSSTSGRKYLQ